jgi:putative transcriptional regulator
MDHLGPEREQKGAQIMAPRTLNEIKASRPTVDRAKLDSTTEEDIRRHMIEDGQDPDEETSDWKFVVSPQLVREKLGMTQEEFARALQVPLETLREWERRRIGLEPAVRSLLAIVYRMPDALKALAA